jgi:peptidyl-prolyl cis-trans isomerase SurA
MRPFGLHQLAAFFLLAAAPAAPPDPALAQAPQGIVAVVNDDIVTSQALANRMRLVRASTDLPDDPETMRRVAQQVLRALIDETLQRQEARRLNITVEPAELAQALDEIARRNGMSTDQLAAYLAERGSTIEALSRQIEAQLAWLKLMARRVRPRVQVSEEQVDLAMRQGGTSASGARELQLSEIVLPVYDPTQEAEVLGAAGQIVAALRGGSQFAALARQVSAAPTADAGGDLGWVPIAVLADEVRAAVATLRPGEVSEPIRGPAGVLILQVRDIRDAGGATPAADGADRQRTRERLIEEQTQRLASRYLRDLRRDAFIDIRF